MLNADTVATANTEGHWQINAVFAKNKQNAERQNLKCEQSSKQGSRVTGTANEPSGKPAPRGGGGRPELLPLPLIIQ